MKMKDRGEMKRGKVRKAFVLFALLSFSFHAQGESDEHRADDADDVAVVSASDEETSGQTNEFVRADGSAERLTSRDEPEGAMNVAVTQQASYKPTESGDKVTSVLNAPSAPVIGKVDFGEADASTVSVWPDNVKPNLLYGLGRSETPSGPFVVEDGAWVRADANGVLHEALSAPKIGPQGFYRVIVR